MIPIQTAFSAIQDMRRLLFSVEATAETEHALAQAERLALDAESAIVAALRLGGEQEVLAWLTDLLPAEQVTVTSVGSVYTRGGGSRVVRAMSGEPAAALPALARLFADLEEAAVAATVPAPPPEPGRYSPVRASDAWGRPQ